MKHTITFLFVAFTVLGSFTLLADASAAPEPTAEPSVERPLAAPVELSSEWRWKREPIRFDHMYMRSDARARGLSLGVR